jgi:hypothetical protein
MKKDKKHDVGRAQQGILEVCPFLGSRDRAVPDYHHPVYLLPGAYLA